MSTSTPALGGLIWISCKPLIRLVISVSMGYGLTRMDLLTPMAARGVGQIILNVTLPALLFAKLVPAFTSQNIVAFGPLVLVAVIYQALGFVFAWIIRLIFWVPSNFHNGILVASAWNNWGDVPVAVVMSITSAAPFNPNTDEALAIAYVSPFILVFFVTLFPMGGSRLLLHDFKDPGALDPGDLGFRERFRSCRRSIRKALEVLQSPRRWGRSPEIRESLGEQVTPVKEATVGEEKEVEVGSPHVAFLTDDSTVVPTHYDAMSPAATTVNCVDDTPGPKRSPSPTILGTSNSRNRYRRQPWRALSHLVPFLRSLLEPICITVIVAIIIALVPTLKALFTPVTGVSISNAPDGLPPLSFVLDIATFFGNASVPMGLICLGSAFATMRLPKPISRAPLGAIISLAFAKMVIVPILGVLITQALTYHTGLMDPNDKVLRFVSMFLSAVPTATTQVYLTQVHSPDGTAEHLPSFLIPQYFFMFFSMTIITAYSLHILF